VTAASDYFIDMGFERPTRATTADFLTSITNPLERIARTGLERQVPRTPLDFEKRWTESKEFHSLCRKIDAFNSEHQFDDTKGQNHESFSIPPVLQIQACVRRGFLRLKNNPVPVLAGVIGNTVIGVVAGSVFYHLPETTSSFQQRSILLFFAIMMNGCSPAFEVGEPFSVPHISTDFNKGSNDVGSKADS
jgi:ATP-binding cassette subfamily G (WHITE) protein 2 (PDR)